MKEVAEFLGNTPALARSSYVDPRVVDAYEEGSTIAAADPAEGRDPERAADHPRARGAAAARRTPEAMPSGRRRVAPDPVGARVYLGEPGPAHVVLRRVLVLLGLQPGLGRGEAQPAVARLADPRVEQGALGAAVAALGQGGGAEERHRVGLGAPRASGRRRRGCRRRRRRTTPSRRRRSGLRRRTRGPRGCLEAEPDRHHAGEVRGVLGAEPGDPQVGLDLAWLGRAEALDEHRALGERRAAR